MEARNLGVTGTGPLGAALSPGLRQTVALCRDGRDLAWYWVWSGPTRDAPSELEPTDRQRAAQALSDALQDAPPDARGVIWRADLDLIGTSRHEYDGIIARAHRDKAVKVSMPIWEYRYVGIADHIRPASTPHPTPTRTGCRDTKRWPSSTASAPATISHAMKHLSATGTVQVLNTGTFIITEGDTPDQHHTATGRGSRPHLVTGSID